MLAAPDGGRLADGAGFSYEYKYDGYRCLARRSASGTTVLSSRNGNDLTAEFEAVARVLTAWPGGPAVVLDGELVALDEAGHPDFGLMQQRRGQFQRGHPAPGEPALADIPVRYLLFDLLWLAGEPLLSRPYRERRWLLEQLPLPAGGPVSVAPAFGHDQLAALGLTPAELLRRAEDAGYEGLVAKSRDGRYHPGRRSPGWLKHPLVHTQEVIVCGWRPGKGRATGMVGGLLLGAHDPATDELIYLGDVGTGLTDRERRDLLTRLRGLERPDAPFAAPVPRADALRAHWVEPTLVGEVEYRRFTPGEGRLRHTSWRGLRADKAPAEVLLPEPAGRPPHGPPLHHPPAAPGQDAPHGAAGSHGPAGADGAPGRTPPGEQRRISVRVGERTLTLSDLDMSVYPDGFGKAEVIDYYRQVAPVLLPQLAGRPVTLVRFPHGVGGGAVVGPRRVPGWVRAGPMIDDLPGLVWAANLAALELHVPQWTLTASGTRRSPDRLVLRLAPGPAAGVAECCRVAERLRGLLAADGLDPVATSLGPAGLLLHCGIRTRGAHRVAGYAGSVGTRLAGLVPELVGTGAVLVDTGGNDPAVTTITPYSLCVGDRPVVATPVTWDEVRGCHRVDGLAFTPEQAVRRIGELGDLAARTATARAPLPGS